MSCGGANEDDELIVVTGGKGDEVVQFEATINGLKFDADLNSPSNTVTWVRNSTLFFSFNDKKGTDILLFELREGDGVGEYQLSSATNASNLIFFIQLPPDLSASVITQRSWISESGTLNILTNTGSSISGAFEFLGTDDTNNAIVVPEIRVNGSFEIKVID